jgi:hypothetical protein
MEVVMRTAIRGWALALAALVAAGGLAAAQTHGEQERFTAVAILSDEFSTGTDRVIIEITRWSTDAERTKLVTTLREKGSRTLLNELAKMRSVGTIRTPDTLAYDLRYAHQTRGKDGGREIVLATDRPIAFWERVSGSRTLEYPFTLIHMQMGPDGKGTGTLSLETKIRAAGNVIEAENYSTAPVRLTEIQAEKLH